MESVEKAKSLIAQKKYSDALDILSRINPEDVTPDIKGLIGLCLYEIKNYPLAQNFLIDSVIATYNEEYAKILEKILVLNRNDEALLGLKVMMAENSNNNIMTLRDVTEIAQRIKNFDIGIEYFKILLEKCPEDYVAWNNLGLIYEEINEWEKAYDCYQKALSLNDFFSPNFNLGIMSRKLHKFGDSIKYLKKAVAQNPTSPQPKYSLAMSYLMKKDFKNGYPLYANHMTKIMPSFYKNEWDGTPHPDNSVCVFATGGLGDMIMFSRYFEYLKNCFKTIYVLMPKTLHKIIKNSFPYVEPVDSDIIFTDFDYATTPMHILKFFDLDFNFFVPNTDGFIKTDTELNEKFRKKFFSNNKLKIGINWHGNREGTRTFFNRSMPLSTLEPIFNKYKDKAVFYSVQKDESHTECSKYPFIVNLYDEIKDFNDTASILSNLDLLISIDSSPVHMAGAIGLKTFMVIPYANEWRWFIDDNKSIWYDSIEIFRQDKEGDWASAVSKVLNKMETIY